jgi:hypothetical protein
MPLRKSLAFCVREGLADLAPQPPPLRCGNVGMEEIEHSAISFVHYIFIDYIKASREFSRKEWIDMAQAQDALHPQPRLWDLETAAQYLAIMPNTALLKPL